VPVIALTANPSRQAHRQFLTEGMNDWLLKPFRDEALYRKIVRHLEFREGVSDRVSNRKFPLRRKPLAEQGRLFDLSLLKKDTPDNPAFIRRMLGIFIDTIPPIVERMKYHFERGEMDEVSELAHKIKPTLDGAGIISLRDTIRNLELHREKRRSPDQIREDMNQLCTVIEKVVEEFRKEMSDLT
jgi:CheY-like chemotaxis protein